jgi:ring-1,2-phenylacetyl-CoA epoxidase subunit PaaB
MKILSLDPRIKRIDAPSETDEVIVPPGENWITYEVFHQKKKGQQHTHVGIVHAPNAEMAMVLAKESFGRRGATSNIWVVPTSEIIAMDYEDSDIFDTTPEKIYREASGYKLRDKVEKFKEEHHE